MSIVQQELTIEDRYSQEVINTARTISTEVNNYLVEQRYFFETPEDNLSPLWIRNRVLLILIDELSEIGIFFNRESDDLVDDVIMHQAIFFLTNKFNPDKLFDVIKDNVELVDLLREACGGSDAVTQVIEVMHNTYPLDEGWEYLYNRGVVIGSDEVFNTLMESIFERIDSYGEPSYEATYTPDQMLSFLDYVNTRNATIEQMACSVFPVTEKDPNSEEVITSDMQQRYAIKKYMESYEKQLMTGDNIIKYINIFIDETLSDDEKLSKYEALRQPYVQGWKHRIEMFYKSKNMLFDYEVALIVASHYQINMTSDQLRAAVTATLNDYSDMGDKCLERFKICLDRMIIPEKEVSVNETV